MRKRKKARTRSDTSSKPRKKAIVKRAKAKKASRVPKTRNANTMSESAFWQFIRAALRNKSRWWKPRLICLQKARRPSQSANKRLKWEYQCNHCKDWWPQTQVEINHIIPVGTLKCAQDLPLFVENLFCEIDNLECVCVTCHKKHHKKEE
jgi:hypothetical protein